jgi:hypothetical protein
MGTDVLVRGKLGQGAFQLLLGEVQCVVVDALGCVLKGLQKEVHFAEIASHT